MIENKMTPNESTQSVTTLLVDADYFRLSEINIVPNFPYSLPIRLVLYGEAHFQRLMISSEKEMAPNWSHFIVC
ncbi:hypothetical protein [Vibrio porteresiae]|uniref:Uncharacterized protein n=1 Tax=Vibrio porteresiae DSM 19223 TaxID=1123496 RepID=A0ABZ0QIN8_9VIBR|nr:hypothetical protein [Vibrio porteresiae]WPC76364.1 hypothetical protein R8Z52_17700 [Vibrio porteresiae DSM 19223]